MMLFYDFDCNNYSPTLFNNLGKNTIAPIN